MDVISLARQTLQLDLFDDNPLPAQLIEAGAILHGMLATSKSPKLKSAIASMCETWYVKGREDKDSVAGNTIVHLLEKTIQSKNDLVVRYWNAFFFLT